MTTDHKNGCRVTRSMPRASTCFTKTRSPPTAVGLGTVNAPTKNTNAMGTSTMGTNKSDRGVSHSGRYGARPYS
jgi:hypothetical protein